MGSWADSLPIPLNHVRKMAYGAFVRYYGRSGRLPAQRTDDREPDPRDRWPVAAENEHETDKDSGNLPRLQLDELLEELQVRIDAARGTQDRVHSLLEAVLSVGRELDLPQVLRSIAEAAVALVD